jgi:hypothetical protein
MLKYFIVCTINYNILKYSLKLKYALICKKNFFWQILQVMKYKHFLLPSNSIRFLKICFCIKIRTLDITYKLINIFIFYNICYIYIINIQVMNDIRTLSGVYCIHELYLINMEYMYSSIIIHKIIVVDSIKLIEVLRCVLKCTICE